MITKKRELQIKKLEDQLNCGEGIHQGRSKFFRRSKFVIRETGLHKPSHTMNLPRHSFNDGFKMQEEISRSSRPVEPQRIQHKSLYDRPFHLLKQYLHRKQKHTFMPLFDTNPERVQDISKAYTTLNQFRVRKSKKVIVVNGSDQIRLPQYRQTNKINKIDEDFISFNASKNLYQMTTKELEESIKWKKEFLNMLNERIKDSKVTAK